VQFIHTKKIETVGFNDVVSFLTDQQTYKTAMPTVLSVTKLSNTNLILFISSSQIDFHYAAAHNFLLNTSQSCARNLVAFYPFC
jgi:carbon monoxide dehydrogenase subunit G